MICSIRLYISAENLGIAKVLEQHIEKERECPVTQGKKLAKCYKEIVNDMIWFWSSGKINHKAQSFQDDQP